MNTSLEQANTYKKDLQELIKNLDDDVAEARKAYSKQRTRVKDTKQYLSGMKTDLSDVIRYIQEPATLKVDFSLSFQPGLIPFRNQFFECAKSTWTCRTR